MKLVLADSEYGCAYTREIEISSFAWNARERCFIFLVGISDGFYHSNFRPSVEVERIDFQASHVRLQLKSQKAVDALAVELLKQNAESAESRANVRMEGSPVVSGRPPSSSLERRFNNCRKMLVLEIPQRFQTALSNAWTGDGPDFWKLFSYMGGRFGWEVPDRNTREGAAPPFQ